MNSNGGPAFPVTPTDRSGQCAPTQMGMSLRDWFAGQALAGLMSQRKAWAEPRERMALDAYDAADAMMRERAK